MAYRDCRMKDHLLSFFAGVVTFIIFIVLYGPALDFISGNSLSVSLLQKISALNNDFERSLYGLFYFVIHASIFMILVFVISFTIAGYYWLPIKKDLLNLLCMTVGALTIDNLSFVLLNKYFGPISFFRSLTFFSVGLIYSTIIICFIVFLCYVISFYLCAYLVNILWKKNERNYFQS